VEITTRIFQPEDYDAVRALWKRSEGVELAEGDDRASIAQFLQRNPGLSSVALRHGTIVGAVLCGHDGRRGVLYHLAVARDARGQGIGRRLVAECVAALRSCGIPRALIMIARDNPRGRRFWTTQGFEEIPNGLPFEMDL
jgi:putative acetyltransferase